MRWLLLLVGKIRSTLLAKADELELEFCEIVMSPLAEKNFTNLDERLFTFCNRLPVTSTTTTAAAPSGHHRPQPLGAENESIEME